MIRVKTIFKNPIYLFLTVLISILLLVLLLNYMYDIGYYLGGAIHKSLE